ncbi:MAG: NADH-quinone oxidoreductase subunit J, partial [Pseudomonadota bacterium]|nr:NADH-quinone oxidoreductase subunit J [Pseudomonadota bacterium]
AALIAGLFGRWIGASAAKLLTTGALVIGAIVLTHRSRGGVRGQDAGKQIRRRPEDAVRNTNPGLGEGIEL